MSKHSMSVASVIADQLGGTGRLKMMIGARDFFSMPDDVAEFGGLQFSIPYPKTNKIKIVLNAQDLYDVEVGRVRRVGGRLTYKVVSTHTDIACDALAGVLERATGLCLAVPRVFVKTKA